MIRDDIRTIVEGSRPRFLASGAGYLGRGDCLELVMQENEPVASYWEDGYSGVCAWAFRFNDGAILLISDYFGSCSGCDAYEAACGREEFYELTRDLFYNGHLCGSVAEAIDYIKQSAHEDKYGSEQAFTQLLPELEAFRAER